MVRSSGYRRAIASEPAFADAHVNLGLLLKEAGGFRRWPSATWKSPIACSPTIPASSIPGMVREQIAQLMPSKTSDARYARTYGLRNRGDEPG